MTTPLTSKLKPIETVYKGYRFRSRLEARWAVWLDALGIKYEYEHQGYDLDGVWYLPDFWVPEWKVFIEVKPFGQLSEDASLKCWRLADQHDDYVLVLAICGNPWVGEHVVHVFDVAQHEKWQCGIKWHMTHYLTHHGTELVLSCHGPQVGQENGEYALAIGVPIEKLFRMPRYRFPVRGDLNSAFTAARQARFERAK